MMNQLNPNLVRPSNGIRKLDPRNAENSEDLFLTEQTLADRWGVSVKSLQAWRWKSCGVAYVKIGRTVRYHLTDIKLYECPTSGLMRHIC